MVAALDIAKSIEASGKIYAVKKNPAKFKKRFGAKAVNTFEKVSMGTDGILGSNDATTYRAISARGNYVAQDRPDGSFASKELYRELATPNAHSLQK